MIYTDLTKLAMKIAFELHKEQVDKSGVPYIYHPIHIAEQMDDEYSTCVAILHDTIEDTDITVEKLYELGFPKEIVEAVLLLSHDKTVSYMEYIAKVKENSIATKVKLADLKHNSDISRMNYVDENVYKRIKKYKQAMDFLLEK